MNLPKQQKAKKMSYSRFESLNTSNFSFIRTFRKKEKTKHVMRFSLIFMIQNFLTL